MASNLRVDTILPSTGTTLGIGTASGTINFLGNSNIDTSGTLTAASASITGNLGVGGTLTYEDVTNIDSVGVITARSSINVNNAAGSGIGVTINSGGINIAGVITATSFSGIDFGNVTGAQGDFSIADKIVHTGDTNTALRFPSADAISAETGGTSRLLIQNNGIEAAAAFYDNSGHSNPDPLNDGSGLAYWKLNRNFQDSGRFGNASGTAIQGGDPRFVSSSGTYNTKEPVWFNPGEGAITFPSGTPKNSYPFSVSAWLWRSSWPTSTVNEVVMNLSIGGQRVTLAHTVWSGTGAMDFYIMYGGSGHHYYTPSSRPVSTWYHIIYSVISSNSASSRIYLNGSLQTYGGNRGGGHGGSAGNALGGNASNTERWTGAIASLRFFNKALTDSEASALYNADQLFTT